MPILLVLLGMGLGAAGLFAAHETVLRPGRRWIAVTFDERGNLFEGGIFDTEGEAQEAAERVARRQQSAILTVAVENERLLPDTLRINFSILAIGVTAPETEFVGPLPG